MPSHTPREKQKKRIGVVRGTQDITSQFVRGAFTKVGRQRAAKELKAARSIPGVRKMLRTKVKRSTKKPFGFVARKKEK